MIDETDRSEFYYLWTLGLPEWLRKKLWQLILGNEAGISENLFNAHLKIVEEIKIEDITSNFNFNDFRMDGTTKIRNKLHIADDPILNEIINDIIKISLKYNLEIKDNLIEESCFRDELFKIVRVFTLFRPDIAYSKQISYIAAVLRLNSDNYYSAFVNLINFIVPSVILKFLIRDEQFVKLIKLFFIF